MSKKTLFAAVLAAGVAIAFLAGTAGARPTGTLKGAGSSFVAPLVALWTSNYKASSISYNAVGSGAGINAITNHQVDFGASDAPLTPDQKGACPCVQIPWGLSATSIAYNIPGASPGLNMTGPILAKIYLGQIDFWDNAAIKKINKGKTIPHVKITPVFRSDGSGTTYNFTDYLSEVSKAFKNKVGIGTQVSFPAGTGARGSSGVASTVKQSQGGLTYVDVAYSLKNRFKIAKVKNRAGKFQLPGIVQIRAAAKSITKLRASQNAYTAVDPNPRQTKAYPICTFTWVIVPLKTDKAPELKKFIDWALTKGQSYGPKLRFVELPKIVQTAARKSLGRVHR